MTLDRLKWPLPLVAVAAIVLLPMAGAQGPAVRKELHGGDDSTLEKVVVLSRHGVRSPLQTADKLAAYSRLPWPKWDVAPGLLTTHGRALMASLGSFYAKYYEPQGLFEGKNCERARDTYVWSDTDERDVSTAQGFLSGLFPGCEVPIHRLEGEDAVDPVVHPLKAHLGHPDRARAAAEVLGRVGGDGENVKIAYMPAFLTLDRILGGCGELKCKGEAPGRQVLFGMSAAIEPADDDDHLIRESKGPLGVGSTLSEIMLLEYAEGKPMNEVGFGRMSRADLTQILGIHSAYFDLAQQTDYPARLGASNLMEHILATLAPASAAAANGAAPRVAKTGGFGPPASRFVFLATHDTNVANVAGFLRAHWMMEGDQADPSPPGGGLVFELRRDRRDGSQWVRVRFISETLDQMHDNTVLTLQHPAAVLPVFVPDCSVAAHGDECPLAAFTRLVNERALPEFTTP